MYIVKIINVKFIMNFVNRFLSNFSYCNVYQHKNKKILQILTKKN